MSTCIELVDIPNPVQADLWDIVEGYLVQLAFDTLQILSENAPYQVIISRYAMYPANANFVKPSK